MLNDRPCFIDNRSVRSVAYEGDLIFGFAASFLAAAIDRALKRIPGDPALWRLKRRYRFFLSLFGGQAQVAVAGDLVPIVT